ncbi:unnamed protein product [Ostreobium quekettii]|uniref:NIF system FeS cluster assembly NifU C-terminal domain-containing protein n=1 Tax=Ostreobium quekettii TaxID=121088 RepID=A0A8S1J5I2_9CHLO|nr:unnamed protein product [Ostreobium quekettii]|eukprot:evm.model.scf_198.12 EVM.evm.TU.scf_198.12   scf_198:119991-121346(+)
MAGVGARYGPPVDPCIALGRAHWIRSLRSPADRRAGFESSASASRRTLQRAAGEEVPGALSSAVVTDDNVPEGHQGLHGYLYGEGGADEHEGRAYEFRRGEDDGSTTLPVSAYLETRDGEKPVGVYALYDVDRNLQYVGFSRNIVLAVKAHAGRVGEDRCAFIRPMVFMNRAMATRSNLEREARNWMDQAGTVPPGNGVEAHLWEGSEGVKSMSSRELEEYEGKKLKLRKAMGENLHDDVAGETAGAKERRMRTIRAVEGDDWSAVIDEQTRQAAGGAPEPVISPFARAQVHRKIGNASQRAELTVENVDAALDEVRPYLISDGGNIEVAGVQGGTVLVRLQGACGTCPSSTATMKMGIERTLRASFGDRLKEIIQVDQQDTSASAASVDEHLNILRPAIEGYGGHVRVVGVEEGVCELQFKGPMPISKGIEAAIKDKFPDVRKVNFVDWQ